jgi:hypothetical protein
MVVANTTTQALRPSLEVADIFRAYGSEYLRTHRLTEAQRRVMRAIVQCRTAALGGHVEECDTCGAQRIAYNSCRNRHCPKCQRLQQALWVEARVAELLPIEYYHVVFTLPHQLNELARWYPREVYDLLFAAASETLQEFGRRKLGGELGLTAVLHTWGQTLQQHPHVHCIVTGGALSQDGERFRRCRQGYLFGVQELSAAYRERYCRGLRHWAEEVAAAGWPPGVELAKRLEELAAELSEVAWVVYAKRPLCGPEQVIEYLSRYTQRVAISNSRLVECAEGRVSFRWKDYRAGGMSKVMRLPAEEFIRRFLQHVLPAGYVRIRHYGLLASRERERKLGRCRELLQAAEVERAERRETSAELLLRITGREVSRCERCGSGEMVKVAEWECGESPPVSLWPRERRAA